MTPSPYLALYFRGTHPIAGLLRGLPCGSEAPGNKKARSGFHRACFGRDQNNSQKRSLLLERGKQYTTDWKDECKRMKDPCRPYLILHPLYFILFHGGFRFASPTLQVWSPLGRIISYRKMPAATPRFSESVPGAMGMVTRRVQVESHRSRIP